MTLHSPAFERNVLRAVKRECRASRPLAREYKRQQKIRPAWRNFLFVKFFSLTLTTVAILGTQNLGGSPVLQAALVTFGAAFFAVTSGQGFVNKVFGSRAMVVLTHLPMAPDRIFDWFWYRHRWNCLTLAIEITLAYALMAYGLELDALGYVAAIILGALQCALILVLSVGAPLRLPMHLLSQWGSVFASAAFLLFLGRDMVPFRWLPVLEWAAWPVNLLLPFGWLSIQLASLAGGLNWALPLLLLPVGWLLRRGPKELVLWRQTFASRSREFIYHHTLEASPQLLERLHRVGYDTGESPKSGLTDSADAIRARRFLESDPWESSALIERWVARWWTPRERTLADFMYYRIPTWTRAWVQAAWVLAGTVAVALFLKYLRMNWYGITYLLGAVVGSSMTLPFSSGFDRGFRNWFIGSTTVSFHAGFPVGYAEVGRAILKMTTVRCLAAAPLLFAFSFTVALAEGASLEIFWVAHAAGLKCALLVCFARPLLTAIRFSSSTDDSVRVRFTNAIVACTIIGTVMLLVALVVAWAIASTLGWVLAGAAAIWVVCYGYYRVYGWYYRWGRFDFLKPPPSQR